MVTLEQIPMRQDNYSYALIKDNAVVMIDPSEPEASRAYFAERPHLSLVAILNTHSHFDHVAGNQILAADWGVPVYGPSPEQERIPALTHPVSDNDVIDVLGMKIIAHDVRAHTVGHAAFHVDAPVTTIIKHGHGRLPQVAHDLGGRFVMFVGDSLFAAGCGRLFEGTTTNLKNALSFYREQHGDILMACGHEYTKANLAFARAMLPHVPAIEKRAASIDGLIAEDGSTVPCLFRLEHDTNPFLLAVIEPHRSFLARKFGVDANDLAAVVGALRVAKDNFAG